MPSLNESIATRLYQWARDLGIVQVEGSWKVQPHEVKEKFRDLARRLHNYLGQEGYPEGDFVVVPEGEYKVRPYTRRYTSVDQGEVGTTGREAEPGAGAGPAQPDPGDGGVPARAEGAGDVQGAGAIPDGPGTESA